MSYDDETKAGAVAIILWGLAALAVVILGALAFGLLQPTLFTMERKVTQASPQYVQSKQNTLIDLKAQYVRLDTEVARYQGNDSVVTGLRAQQKAVLSQMYQEKSLLAPDAVPADVQEFLKQHPQGS